MGLTAHGCVLCTCMPGCARVHVRKHVRQHPTVCACFPVGVGHVVRTQRMPACLRARPHAWNHIGPAPEALTRWHTRMLSCQPPVFDLHTACMAGRMTACMQPYGTATRATYMLPWYVCLYVILYILCLRMCTCIRTCLCKYAYSQICRHAVVRRRALQTPALCVAHTTRCAGIGAPLGPRRSQASP